PSPALPFAVRKGGGGSCADSQTAAVPLFAPSLSHSEGEGWGGVLFAHNHKQKEGPANSGAFLETPITSPTTTSNVDARTALRCVIDDGMRQEARTVAGDAAVVLAHTDTAGAVTDHPATHQRIVAIEHRQRMERL